MSQSLENAMLANLHDVFGERDADRRQLAIFRLFTADSVFLDEEGEIRGHGAIAAKVQAILDDTPGFVLLSVEGDTRSIDDTAYLKWTLGPVGQPPIFVA